MAQRFRANVGAVVADARGRVLALQRSGRVGAWQLPQGGLDEGEEPPQAALRELEEETGLSADDVELVAEHPRWLAYELPEEFRNSRTGRGQVQKWFLFRLRDGTEIDLSRAEAGEFDDHKWTTLRALAAEVWFVRRDVYEQLADAFAQNLIAPNQSEG
jgi:putative (di)nucleoside polyphosphate hydrolase